MRIRRHSDSAPYSQPWYGQLWTRNNCSAQYFKLKFTICSWLPYRLLTFIAFVYWPWPYDFRRAISASSRDWKKFYLCARKLKVLRWKGMCMKDRHFYYFRKKLFKKKLLTDIEKRVNEENEDLVHHRCWRYFENSTLISFSSFLSSGRTFLWSLPR